MIRYGNLDRLTPIGFSPNYTLVGPSGFSPDTVDRNFECPFGTFLRVRDVVMLNHLF